MPKPLKWPRSSGRASVGACFRFSTWGICVPPPPHSVSMVFCCFLQEKSVQQAFDAGKYSLKCWASSVLTHKRAMQTNAAAPVDPGS
eukprot:2147706-Amphidinium_carterae.2